MAAQTPLPDNEARRLAACAITSNFVSWRKMQSSRASMCLNIANESVTVKDPPNVSYFVKLGPLPGFETEERTKIQK